MYIEKYFHSLSLFHFPYDICFLGPTHQTLKAKNKEQYVGYLDEERERDLFIIIVWRGGGANQQIYIVVLKKKEIAYFYLFLSIVGFLFLKFSILT